MSALHNSESFIRYAQNNGDLFTADVDVYNKYFKPSISRCENRWSNHRGYKNDAGNSFEFELGLIENKNFPNAICAFDGTKHIIMMYHTFPLMLLELFGRMLTNEKFLSGVGNPKLSPNYLSTYRSAPGFAVLSGEVKINHVDELMTIFGPHCEVRREIAFRLYHYAMESIWEHEMTHAIHGHVHFCAALNLRNLNECYIHRPDVIEKNAAFQFAEMVADRGATFSLVISELYHKFYRSFAVTSNDAKRSWIARFEFLPDRWSLFSLCWLILVLLEEMWSQ